MFGSGFLGNAPLGADLNLFVQGAVALALLIGMWLARRGSYRAHGACQASAFLVTLAMTLVWMTPAFHEVFLPGLARDGVNRINAAVAAHAALGTTTLILGVYVILVAATNLVPERLRFQDYKAWMRTLLGLWLATLGLGATTYWIAWLSAR